MGQFFRISLLILGVVLIGAANCDPECEDLDWNDIKGEFFTNDACKSESESDQSCYKKCIFEKYGYFCAAGQSHSDKVPNSIPKSVPESVQPILTKNIQSCFDDKNDKVNVTDCQTYDSFSDCVDGQFSASTCPDDNQTWWE